MGRSYEQILRLVNTTTGNIGSLYDLWTNEKKEWYGSHLITYVNPDHDLIIPKTLQEWKAWAQKQLQKDRIHSNTYVRIIYYIDNKLLAELEQYIIPIYHEFLIVKGRIPPDLPDNTADTGEVPPDDTTEDSTDTSVYEGDGQEDTEVITEGEDNYIDSDAEVPDTELNKEDDTAEVYSSGELNNPDEKMQADTWLYILLGISIILLLFIMITGGN